MNGRSPQAPLRIVYFALINSTVIYALIVWFLSRTWPTPGPLEEVLRRPVILTLMIVSLATFTFSFSLGAWANETIWRQWNRFIVRWAIIESVAIDALAATFIAQDWRPYAIGWVLALIGFVLASPPGREA